MLPTAPIAFVYRRRTLVEPSAIATMDDGSAPYEADHPTLERLTTKLTTKLPDTGRDGLNRPGIRGGSMAWKRGCGHAEGATTWERAG